MIKDSLDKLLDQATRRAYQNLAADQIKEYKLCKYLGHIKDKERYSNRDTEYVCNRCYRLVKSKSPDQPIVED